MARSRPQPRSSGISLAPVFAILGLVLLVGGVIMLSNLEGSKGAAPASTAQPAGPEKKDWVNPFADLDDSRVQVPSAGRKMKDISPPGLMETELFVRAKQLAEDGQELAKEAFAARDSGDKERFRELGLQAREKLFEATALTADWWIELNEKYPDDRQIEKISRVRSRWDRSFNQLRVIR